MRVFACVGGGSNAIGIFHAFIPDDAACSLIGVEAGGRGDELGEHAARFSRRRARRAAGRLQLPAAGRRRADRAHALGLGGPRLRADRPGARAGCTIGTAPSTVAATTPKRSTPRSLLARTEGIIPALESRARRRRSDPARARAPRARSSSSTSPAAATRTSTSTARISRNWTDAMTRIAQPVRQPEAGGPQRPDRLPHRGRSRRPTARRRWSRRWSAAAPI